MTNLILANLTARAPMGVSNLYQNVTNIILSSRTGVISMRRIVIAIDKPPATFVPANTSFAISRKSDPANALYFFKAGVFQATNENWVAEFEFDQSFEFDTTLFNLYLLINANNTGGVAQYYTMDFLCETD